jgi:hypothetical protein
MYLLFSNRVESPIPEEVIAPSGARMSKPVTKKNQVTNQSVGESAASAPAGHGARPGDAVEAAPLPKLHDLVLSLMVLEQLVVPH